MYRTLVFVASLVGAAAFAPISQVARSSVLKMSFESELGAQAPLGFWDPLGLLEDADQSRFDRLRTVETKHGRISMVSYFDIFFSMAETHRHWLIPFVDFSIQTTTTSTTIYNQLKNESFLIPDSLPSLATW